MPYVDSILEISITDASPFFNRGGAFLFLDGGHFRPKRVY